MDHGGCPVCELGSVPLFEFNEKGLRRRWRFIWCHLSTLAMGNQQGELLIAQCSRLVHWIECTVSFSGSIYHIFSQRTLEAEILFDQGLGSMFVVRVAGNILDPSAIPGFLLKGWLQVL